MILERIIKEIKNLFTKYIYTALNEWFNPQPQERNDGVKVQECNPEKGTYIPAYKNEVFNNNKDSDNTSDYNYNPDKANKTINDKSELDQESKTKAIIQLESTINNLEYEYTQQLEEYEKNQLEENQLKERGLSAEFQECKNFIQLRTETNNIKQLESNISLLQKKISPLENEKDILETDLSTLNNIHNDYRLYRELNTDYKKNLNTSKELVRIKKDINQKEEEIEDRVQKINKFKEEILQLNQKISTIEKEGQNLNPKLQLEIPKKLSQAQEEKSILYSKTPTIISCTFVDQIQEETEKKTEEKTIEYFQAEIRKTLAAATVPNITPKKKLAQELVEKEEELAQELVEKEERFELNPGALIEIHKSIIKTAINPASLLFKNTCSNDEQKIHHAKYIENWNLGQYEDLERKKSNNRYIEIIEPNTRCIEIIESNVEDNTQKENFLNLILQKITAPKVILEKDCNNHNKKEYTVAGILNDETLNEMLKYPTIIKNAKKSIKTIKENIKIKKLKKKIKTLKESKDETSQANDKIKELQKEIKEELKKSKVITDKQAKLLKTTKSELEYYEGKIAALKDYIKLPQEDLNNHLEFASTECFEILNTYHLEFSGCLKELGALESQHDGFEKV